MKNKCLIIGFGNSGMWAYNLTLNLGYMPIIYDDKFMKMEDIQNLDINFSFAVISPGVSKTHDIVLFLQKKQVQIISEIELCFLARKVKSKIIGVTGTNGKTTVVSMLGEVLGEDSVIAGNIGIPWSKVLNKETDNVVLELSSFQLEFCNNFTPNIAIFTNLAPDHLDYHKTFESYINAKMNLVKNMDENSVIIYFADDLKLKREIENQKLKNVYYFSLTKKEGDGVYIDDNNDVVCVKGDNKIKLCSFLDFGGLMYHNKLNALVVLLVAFLLNKNIQSAVDVLKNFKLPRFRQEVVENDLGLKIINDSKSTNLASTLVALKNYKDITLIVGGRGKNETYEKLFSDGYDINKIVAYGESRFEFLECAKANNFSNIKEFQSFDDAVKYVLKNTKTGTVLFSPACSSYDQFKSYEERGERFNQLVKNS